MTGRTHDPMIGHVIDGLTLQRRLGAGAMGSVYLAQDPIRQRKVAVKILRRNDADQRLAHQARRLLREAQALMAVDHPNIVKVYGTGSTPDIHYLVMDYIAGADFKAVVKENGALSHKALLEAGRALASGLAALHAAGVVHRDLKSANILLSRDGVLKICDLGLARLAAAADATRLTSTGIMLGTPLYMAPESIRSASGSGPASDCYAWGATMFHLATGRPPFEAPHSIAVITAHLKQPPPVVRRHAPDTPPHLADLIDACLRKEPAKRPDASAIEAALNRPRQEVAAKSGQGTRPGLMIAAAIAAAVVITVGASLSLLSANTADEAHLHAPSGIEYQTPSGSWQAWPEPGFTRAEIPQAMRLRQQDGTGGWQFSDLSPADIAPAEPESPTLSWPSSLTWVLSANLVTHRLIEAPLGSAGLWWVDGAPLGFDSTFELAGQPPQNLARWDGRQFVFGEWDGGKTIEWQRSSRPAGNGWWKAGLNGQKFHIIVVYEWACLSGHPQPSANWSPITGLDIETVAERLPLLLTWGVRLPNTAEAMQLTENLGIALWARESGFVKPIGGRQGQARLIVFQR
jgi:serine/threonine protein kinase